MRLLSPTDGDIYAIEVDGTGLRRLTDGPALDFAPTCSPDGQRVAFSSNRSGQLAIHELPLAPAVGRSPAGVGVALLVPRALDPDYSPDGKTLTYAGEDPVDGSVEVFTRDLATGQTTQVSSSPQPIVNRLPRFFPGGTDVQWTQLGATAPSGRTLASLAGDDNGDSPDKEIHSTDEDFEPVEDGGNGAIRPGRCICERLAVILPDDLGTPTVHEPRPGTRLTRFHLRIPWILTCSEETGGCVAFVDLSVSGTGFSVTAVESIAGGADVAKRRDGSYVVICRADCEEVRRGRFRVTISSPAPIARLQGKRIVLRVSGRPSGCFGRPLKVSHIVRRSPAAPPRAPSLGGSARPSA